MVQYWGGNVECYKSHLIFPFIGFPCFPLSNIKNFPVIQFSEWKMEISYRYRILLYKLMCTSLFDLGSSRIMLTYLFNNKKKLRSVKNYVKKYRGRNILRFFNYVYIPN